MAPVAMHRVTQRYLKVRPQVWPFAAERLAEIDAHFAVKRHAIPTLWNGRILLARNPAVAAGPFSAGYFEAAFASFPAGGACGCPGVTRVAGFGMRALRTCDGGVVLGEMSRHTANAGLIYFPSGTPDRS